MKTFAIHTLAALSLTATAVADIFVAATPAIPDKQIRNDLYVNLTRFCLEKLEPGEKMIVYNGWTLAPVTTIELPPSPAYAKDLRVRMQAVKPALGRLADWMRKTGESSSQCPDYALDVPRIFSVLAGNTKAAETKSQILLVGSSLVASPQVAFHCIDGLCPSDHHLRVNPTRSVFGLSGAEGRLNDCMIYWITLNKESYLDSAHEYCIDRFWTLFMQTQGAKLATFLADANTVMDQLSLAASRPLLPIEMKPGDKVEMNRVKMEDIATGVGSFMVLPANQRTVEPLTSPKFRVARIGIKWVGDMDMDLYVQAGTPFKELYFGCTASSQGRHTKDWTSQPGGAAFETVELVEQPGGEAYDLSTLRISVNLYRGNAAVRAPSGIVRMEVEGKIYEQGFSIPLPAGNGGGDEAWTTRTKSGHWVIINPLTLTKLQAEPAPDVSAQAARSRRTSR